MSELDALTPRLEQVTLSSGAVTVIQDLKTRQFLKLLRIFTHGALRELSIFQLGSDADKDEFGAKLLSLVLMSVPDAEDEAIEFVQSMCKPYGLIEGRALNKQDKERNAELWRQLDSELENPELDDLITIVEAIVRREAADIQALGKRLAAMLNLAKKTGQLSNSPHPTSPTPNSSAASAEASTSSPPSTAGQTTSSAASPSDAYASVSPQSGSDASTPSGGASNG